MNNRKEKFEEYKETSLSLSFEEFLSGWRKETKKEEREGFERGNAMTSSADRI